MGPSAILRCSSLALTMSQGGMSALSPFYPQLRTLVHDAWYGSFVPQKATYAPQQNECLFEFDLQITGPPVYLISKHCLAI